MRAPWRRSADGKLIDSAAPLARDAGDCQKRVLIICFNLHSIRAPLQAARLATKAE
ncbi:protein of unknown function [Methylocella tundrae]|uniref:Uncharacterized protein n=1 Tax=Methylocella tundrae TaxID=227605 RepID=A0A4U8Z6S0_METTU|nr:protein of unknown function [Methylocella tundrae]